MAWKPEVFVKGKWSRNALVFATRKEAEASAQDLMERLVYVENFRAIEVAETPNYRWVDGKLEEIKQ